MKRPGLSLALGVLLLLIGAGCINYARLGNREHHLEWSAEQGLPSPSDEILFTGYGCAVLGAVMVISGWRGRRRGSAKS